MYRGSAAGVALAVMAGVGAAEACEVKRDFCPPSCGQVFMHLPGMGYTGPTTLDGELTPNAKNMTFLSQVTLAQMAAAQGLASTLSVQGSSLWGWVDPLTGSEYALMGRNRGLSIIDVTNPRSPVIVASVPNASSTATSWREPKVIGNRAFIGVDGTTHGVQAIDLEKIRPVSLGGMYNGTPLMYGTAGLPITTYSSVTREHTLAINATGGEAQASPDGKYYLYVAGSNLNSSGIHVVDVDNFVRNGTGTLTAAGGFGGDGYTHEMQVVTYRNRNSPYNGRELVFAYNGKSGSGDSFSIVDVTNNAAPVRIGGGTLGGGSYPQVGYIHQGWLTEDQKYVIQNDETDEPGVGNTRTHFWDVSDITNPVYKGYYRHTTSSVDHNLYVKGGYVYMSNYTTGLQVFKLGDLTSNNANDWMTRVAYFDTYSANDGSSFNGAWNNYPFFPSGNIAISDINGGLIMVKMNLPKQLEALFPYIPGGDAPVPTFSTSSIPEPAVGLTGTLAMLALRRRRDPN